MEINLPSVMVRTERSVGREMVVDFEGNGKVVRSLKYLVGFEVSALGKVDMTLESEGARMLKLSAITGLSERSRYSRPKVRNEEISFDCAGDVFREL